MQMCLWQIEYVETSWMYDELKTALSSRTAMHKWQIQVLDWRSQLGCKGDLDTLRPWTGFRSSRSYLGIRPTSRVLAVLDLVTIEILGGAQQAVQIMKRRDGEKVIEKAMEDILVDISQNPIRRAFSNQDKIAKCMTTSSCLYSFKLDRVVLPFEQMLIQGHTTSLQLPGTMTQKSIQDLAGMGICLPCLGLIVVAMLATTGF